MTRAPSRAGQRDRVAAESDITLIMNKRVAQTAVRGRCVQIMRHAKFRPSSAVSIRGLHGEEEAQWGPARARQLPAGTPALT